jgi:uncharacterized protein
MTRAEILSLSKIIGKPRNRNDIERLDLCGITTRRGPSLVERFTMNSATKRQNPLRRARQAGKRGCCAIAVMAKASSAGRTKTRLVPPLTLEQAAELNTAFIADVADNLALAARQADIDAYMAFGPPGSAPFFEDHLPREVGLIETWFPNFGDCLFHAARSLFDLGYGASCVLNSDSPTLPTEWLVKAARELARPGDRIVLGPSIDGGYYFLGLKQPHRHLFDDIAWSTEQVARQTLARAADLGLESVMLPSWYDVDDAAALQALIRETLFGIGYSASARTHDARHSAAALRRIMEDRSLPEQAEPLRYGRLSEAGPA